MEKQWHAGGKITRGGKETREQKNPISTVIDLALPTQNTALKYNLLGGKTTHFKK